MEDISAIITILRIEAKFADKKVKELMFKALNCVNSDMIKGEYDALPQTVTAVNDLTDYLADRDGNDKEEDEDESKKAPLNQSTRRKLMLDEEDDEDDL